MPWQSSSFPFPRQTQKRLAPRPLRPQQPKLKPRDWWTPEGRQDGRRQGPREDAERGSGASPEAARNPAIIEINHLLTPLHVTG